MPVRENTSSKKQAPLSPLLEESPERKRDNIVTVVTVTKRENKSSKEEDSTRRELSVIQVKTSNPSSTSATNSLTNMSAFDTKLEYLLINHFRVIGNGLEI